jgi:hypothetical protein
MLAELESRAGAAPAFRWPCASTFAAGLLFAAIHYPLFPWRYCVPKGIAYFFVALFILPYGIWSVLAAHLLLDVSIFIFMLPGKVGAKPNWQRLLQAIRGT